MVFTVTLNPALDYVLGLDKIGFEDINRAESAKLFYGGKGINVSAVLNELGIKNTALGFAAGFSGSELIRMLNAAGISSDFVLLENGCTRINVKIRAERELDFNAPGPCFGEAEITALLAKLDSAKPGDFVVLSGALPKDVPQDAYERILKYVADKGVNAVVDTSGAALMNTLKYKPFLVKPNHLELGELFGAEIKTAEDARRYALKLKELGAKNVLVTMAENGAVLIDENENSSFAESPEVVPVSSTCCGDSAVAGFIAGYIKYGDYKKALKLACACGAAAASVPATPDSKTVKSYL